MQLVLYTHAPLYRRRCQLPNISLGSSSYVQLTPNSSSAIHKGDMDNDHAEDNQSFKREPFNLSVRANECTDMTEWKKLICENMPSRTWFWGAGGVLGFCYAPSLLVPWLNWAGSNHLSVSVKPTHHNKLSSNLHTTRLQSNENDVLIQRRRVAGRQKGSQSPRPSPYHRLHDKHAFGETDDGDYHCTGASCIGTLLKFHIIRSSETQRYACRPIDNQGAWHATIWLMINHGQNNQGTHGLLLLMICWNDEAVTGGPSGGLFSLVNYLT
ncbi:hypothetical protein B0H66DRAFT_536386 [Apodospora peruviana]|uniref:Uncharacterized protein n=1 Tax=Apodospora peruviana TaxID=516989 RepID=A0AAE0HZ22_9PEZI|nr:hypothetical protein B0H66DRAFT_536386 [Apodospora peruviana]